MEITCRGVREKSVSLMYLEYGDGEVLVHKGRVFPLGILRRTYRQKIHTYGRSVADRQITVLMDIAKRNPYPILAWLEKLETGEIKSGEVFKIEI